jgi:hypothetical protein
MTYLCGIVVVTVLSGLGYFIRFKFLFLEKKEEKSSN